MKGWIALCLFWMLFSGMIMVWMVIDDLWVAAAFNLAATLCWTLNLGYSIREWSDSNGYR